MTSDKKDDTIKLSKAGNLWSESDAKEVKKLLQDGKSIPEIAKAVDRTDGAIKARFKIWALKEVEEGGNRDDVFKKYKLLNKDGIVTDVPARFWTDEEVRLLTRHTQEGKSIPEISKLLIRTESNILSKLNSLAYDEIKNGGQKDKIIIKYRLNKDTYEKFEAKKDGKDKKERKSKSQSQPAIDLTEINQKINTLTNLINLVLKNQEDQSKKLDIIHGAL